VRHQQGFRRRKTLGFGLRQGLDQGGEIRARIHEEEVNAAAGQQPQKSLTCVEILQLTLLLFVGIQRLNPPQHEPQNPSHRLRGQPHHP